MLNKIFISQGKTKDIFNPLYSKVLSSGFDKIDFERDREIKLLQNLFSRKFDQDYIDKCSLLLYRCKKTNNYPVKRMHIKKTIYNFDENNDLYITLPKFKSLNKNMKDKSKTIDYSTKEINNYFITDKNEFTEKEDKYFDNLRKKINEGIENDNLNFNTIDNEEVEEEISQKEKRLYNILKTRYPTMPNDNHASINLPKIVDKKNREEILLQRRIMDIDPILGQKINQNKSNTLTKNQQLNIFYLSELDVYNNLDKINKKKIILNKSKNQFLRKNKVLLKDLFHYDKEKWAKIRYERNFNVNEAKIKEYNEENRQKLDYFKNNIDKLEVEKDKTEKDVQEALSHIESFLQKNSASISTTPVNEKMQTPRSVKPKIKK